MGVSLTQASAILTALADAGQIYDVTSVTPASVSGATHRELRVGARIQGQPVETFVEAALDHRVLVHGSGSVAAAIFEDLHHTIPQLGWEPASTARVRPEDAVGAIPVATIGRAWTEFEQTVTQPTLIIAVGDVIDVSTMVEKFPGSALLPVIAHQHRFAIGPLLETVGSLCARCIHHNREANDSEWGFAITQLTHHKRALPVHSLRHINNVASTVTLNVDLLLRNHATYGLLTESFELIPPHPHWLRRTWQQIEGCDCLQRTTESQSVE